VLVINYSNKKAQSLFFSSFLESSLVVHATLLPVPGTLGLVLQASSFGELPAHDFLGRFDHLAGPHAAPACHSSNPVARLLLQALTLLGEQRAIHLAARTLASSPGTSLLRLATSPVDMIFALFRGLWCYLSFDAFARFPVPRATADFDALRFIFLLRAGLHNNAVNAFPFPAIP